MFFAKFLSHRVKNEKVMTKTSSQLNAPVLMTEGRLAFVRLSKKVLDSGFYPVNSGQNNALLVIQNLDNVSTPL